MIPYTTIPVISAFFLVLVGVLMGHFYWSRKWELAESDWRESQLQVDETKNLLQSRAIEMDALSQRSETLERQTQELALALTSAEVTIQRLQREQADQLQLHEQERSTRQQLEALVLAEREELQSAQTQSTRLGQDYEQTRQALTLSEQANRDLQAQVRSCQELIKQLTEQGQAQHDELTTYHAQWQEAERQRVEFANQLASAQQRDELSTHERAEWAQQQMAREGLIQKLATQLRESQVHADDLQRQLDLLAEAHDTRTAEWSAAQEVWQAETEANDQREQALAAQVAELSAEIARERTNRVAAQQDWESACAEWQAALAEADRRWQDAQVAQSESVSEQARALEHAESGLQAAQSTIASLAQRNQELTQQVELARRELDDMRTTQQTAQTLAETQWQDRERQLTGQLTEREQEAQHQHERLERLTRELQAVHDELSQREHAEEREASQTATIRQLQQEVRDLQKARDEALMAASATREIVAELRDELADRLESFDEVAQQKEHTQRELEVERQRRQQADEGAARWEHEWQLAKEQLELRASQTAQADSRQESWLEQIRELSQQLESWRARAHEGWEKATTLEGRTHELQAQLAQLQSHTRQTRAKQLAEGSRESARTARSIFSFRGARVKEETLRKQDTSSIRQDPRFGKVFATTPYQTDDLTLIPGVNSTMEQALHALGVYTYRQIMEWTHEIRDAFQAQLDHGPIVEQHDWIGHARRLYHAKSQAAA